MSAREMFRRFATRSAEVLGSPRAFGAAIFILVIWALTGPHFRFSDTWQLIINTGTSVVTLLMVFLIQHTQNRDTKAMHLKLDELLRSVKDARTRFVRLEEMSDDDLDRLRLEFEKLRAREERKKAQPSLPQ
jgi:low affinity Fe/Cu permease